jgi:hypothetical protein
VCCDGLLIIFQFFTVALVWMLLTGSEDELCGQIPALFQAVAYHRPTVSPMPFQPLFTESSYEDQLLLPPPFSSVLTAPHPVCCVVVLSSLFIVHFVLFCKVEGQSARGAMLAYPRMAVGILCDAWCSHVGLPNVSQAGFQLASGSGSNPNVVSV